MERKKTIQELTRALQQLKLQEADLTTQLVEAVGEERDRRRGKEELAQHRAQEAPVVAGEERAIHGFSKGDRIRIINTLRKPASWDNSLEWHEGTAKNATVTDILIKGRVVQVHFVTDNGVSTWRSPNNVRLLAAQHTTR